MKLKEIERNCWVFDSDYPDNAYFEKFKNALDALAQGKAQIGEKIFKKMLEDQPNHIDVLHHLSILFEQTGRPLEAYLMAREACRIGFLAFPKNFKWDSAKLEWGFLENRPFLRAYHGLGLWHIARQEHAEALEVFKKLISLSTNDNLGARYLLLNLLLQAHSLDDALKLYDVYPDDYSPEFYYGKVILYVLKNDISKAELAFEQAIIKFPLVAKELKKKRHSKPANYNGEYVMIGGKDQAYVYWLENGELWEGEQMKIFLASH